MPDRRPRIEWINVIVLVVGIPSTIAFWLWAIPALARAAAALFAPH